jgi:putative flippase GtrA
MPVRLIKFLVTGGIAAVAEYVSFLFLGSVINLAIVPSNVISFTVGLAISFILNKTWVFMSKNNGHRQLAYYLVLAVANAMLGSAIIWALVDVLSFSSYLAKIVVMALVASWNYLLYSKIIFADKNDNAITDV